VYGVGVISETFNEVTCLF